MSFSPGKTFTALSAAGAAASDLIRSVRQRGMGDVGQRIVRRLYDSLDAGALDFPLLPEDIADSSRMPDFGLLPSRPRAAGGPLTIGWVCTPPGAGSGGHTTLFRMVEELSVRGHRCILFLYDRHGGDLDHQSRVIRDAWPSLTVEIRNARDGIFGVDAAVASSWQTAHVLASRLRERASLLYFIQDFEPYFYPRGSMQALAEDSYRFGFTNIALGEMVAHELQSREISCAIAPFGCDTEVYSRSNQGERSGVVFYTKPGVDRRGFLLAQRGLDEFHRRHPEQEIHIYGAPVEGWKTPVTRHDRLTPSALNALYNQSLAGIAMSFTNISLVAEELLAAGTIPVVNDSPQSRADLDNPHVAWAAPTAGGIADALCRVVEASDPKERSWAAAASVRRGWRPAQLIVADAVVAAAGDELLTRSATIAQSVSA
jgi:hypothetical protein